MAWQLFGRFFGSSGFLWLGSLLLGRFLDLFGLLDLLDLVGELEGSGGTGSLGLLQLSIGNGFLQVATDEGSQLGGIALVVGGDVLFDRDQRRSLAVLQGLDGCLDHVGDWGVSGGRCWLPRLGCGLLCWCCCICHCSSGVLRRRAKLTCVET